MKLATRLGIECRRACNDADRASFWEYFKQDWRDTHYVVHDPDPLGQPWWLKKPEDDDEKKEADPMP